MSVSYAYGEHAFYNIDSFVDFLIGIGMRPLFEVCCEPQRKSGEGGEEGQVCAMTNGRDMWGGICGRG